MTSVSTDRRLGLNGWQAIKIPVACATTANITLSGEQTIDDVLTAASRVLVKNQATASNNGVYDSDSGLWTRAYDFNGTYDVTQGTLIYVAGGTANGGQVWLLSTANPITIGTTNLSFTVGLFSSINNASFLQAGTGAVARTVQAKERDTVSVKDFGAVGNGTTDDTAAITLALAASPNVYFPAGTYQSSGGHVITNGGLICGDGVGISIIRLTSTTAILFAVRSQGGVQFSDLTLQAVGTQTAGALVSLQGVTPGSTINYYSLFRNVKFLNPWIGLNAIDAQSFLVDGCQFIAVQSDGIRINNTVTPDGGDDVITNNVFGGSAVAGSVAIRQYASSGLRIQNNKFFGYPRAYHMQLQTGVGDLGQLYIQGNSFEPCSGGTLLFETANIAATWSIFNITNNFFSSPSTVAIATGPTAVFVSFLIENNLFSLGSAGTGINFQSAYDSKIDNNQFKGAAGTTSGIVLAGGLTGIDVGLNNQYISITTKESLSGCVVAGGYPQEGTSNVTMTCGTSGTITLTAYTLAYTKIGRQVTVTGGLTVASVNAPVGSLDINGLPFTVNNSDTAQAPVSVMADGLEATAATELTGYCLKNTTQMRLYHFAAGALANAAADVKAGSAFYLRATYFV